MTYNVSSGILNCTLQ